MLYHYNYTENYDVSQDPNYKDFIRLGSFDYNGDSYDVEVTEEDNINYFHITNYDCSFHSKIHVVRNEYGIDSKDKLNADMMRLFIDIITRNVYGRTDFTNWSFIHTFYVSYNKDYGNHNMPDYIRIAI